jgi:hypothetical protein
LLGGGNRQPGAQHLETVMDDGHAQRRRQSSGCVGRTRITLLLVLTLMTLVLAGVTEHAGAASTTPGDFSSRLANNPTVASVDDCRVELGFVFDSVSYPNYRHIGGVRVNCSSRHKVLDATVAIYYHNGIRWTQYGSSAYGVRYNQTGSGSGLEGILQTQPYCVGAYRGYYWIVGATVRTERSGATFFSQTPVKDAQAGC